MKGRGPCNFGSSSGAPLQCFSIPRCLNAGGYLTRPQLPLYLCSLLSCGLCCPPASPPHAALQGPFLLHPDRFPSSLPLPPAAADGDSLFCIRSGEMSGVICDQSDPQLVAAAHIAARQLLFSASEEKEVGLVQYEENRVGRSCFCVCVGGEEL